jgi:hypothetical protein
MKWSLPWLASLFAGVLLSTPTYGIGVAISPLTLIGSWIALQHGTRTTATRVGGALNLLLVVAGLSGLTAVWGLNGWLATAWGLAVVILGSFLRGHLRRMCKNCVLNDRVRESR